MKQIKLEKDELELLIDILDDGDTIKDENSPKCKLLKKLEKIRDKKPILVSSRKAKGRNLQYKVCQMIADCIEETYDQHNDDCNIHSNEMGQSGKDIILRNSARKKFPFSIECKCQEQLSIGDWIAQAKANTEKNTDWMLIFQKHSLGTKPVVCLDFDVFLKHWHELKKLEYKWIHKKSEQIG